MKHSGKSSITLNLTMYIIKPYFQGKKKIKVIQVYSLRTRILVKIQKLRWSADIHKAFGQRPPLGAN